MIYTPMTKKALKLCFDTHKEQTDKSGMPYVFHPFYLASQMKDEDSTIVALLHDVIEDSDLTIEDLRKMGFNENVLEAIKLLTHDDPSVLYLDYVAQIKTNPLATVVKLADLRHNSDITRMDIMSPRDKVRQEKYKRAIELLEN